MLWWIRVDVIFRASSRISRVEERHSFLGQRVPRVRLCLVVLPVVLCGRPARLTKRSHQCVVLCCVCGMPVPSRACTQMAAFRRVAIQGGGVTGLTLALALARRGNNVTTVLGGRAATTGAASGSLWLGPRALDVLHALGPELETAVRAAGSPTKVFTTLNGVGRVYGTAPLVGLGIAHASLVQLLEKEYLRVTSRTVALGNSVKRVEHDSKGLVLQTSRRGTQLTLRADALVAADGIMSPIRPLVTDNARTPVPAGVAHWWVTLPLSVSGDDAATVCEYWAAGRRLLMWPSGQKQWTAVGVSAAKPSGAVAAFRPLKHFRDEFAPFFDSPLARALFAAAAASDGNVLVRQGARVPVPYEAVPGPLPVVLLGDAVHGCSLSAAWGVTLALEDAYTLAQHDLDNAGMRQWAQSRRARWNVAVAEARQEDRLLISGGGRMREVSERGGCGRLHASLTARLW